MNIINNKEFETTQYTYHFKYKLDYIWPFFHNFSIISLIAGEQHCHPIFINGNSYQIGSEFIGILFGELQYKGKIIKIENFPTYKKIKWILNFKNGGFLSFKIELFKVTEDNTSICVITFKNDLILTEKMKFINGDENYNKFIKTIEEVLKQSNINLVQYESGIISGLMEDIWEFISCPSKLKKIAPLIKIDGDEDYKEFNSQDNLVFFIENHSKKIYTKILSKSKNEKWNKWVLILDIQGEPKIPAQKLIIELTKINNTDCQLILLNKFDEFADNDYIKKISDEKKYIIKSIKDYLENYKN